MPEMNPDFFFDIMRCLQKEDRDYVIYSANAIYLDWCFSRAIIQ